MNWVILLLLNKIYSTPYLLTAYKALKYLVHATIQTSEIYRLCNSTTIDLGVSEKESSYIVIDHVAKDVVFRIDKSISYSTQLEPEKQQLQLQECEIDDVSKSILIKKQFPEQENSPAIQVLVWSLERIHQSNQVLYTIEQQVKTKYDTSNQEHEEKLIKLWSLLMPETKLESRLTKQWVDIGFQGSDPATDFRGMGIQGLDDLIYFAETHPNHARSALQHASHPIAWYPFAIVGINMTKFAYQLLESKKLQLYLFQYGATVESYHEFYCHLFHHFNQFWIQHVPQLTVMEFEAKFDQFKTKIQNDLIMETIQPLASLDMTETKE